MSMELGDTFNAERYIAWHNTNVDVGGDVEKSITELIASVREHIKPFFPDAGELLTMIRQAANAEIMVKEFTAIKDNYELPLNALSGRNPSEQGALFKSTESTLDKLWRRNRERAGGNYVRVQDIKDNIHDIVRASVICPSLFHARMFSERLAKWDAFRPPERLSMIEKVHVENEAKLSDGYFAYHALVYFVGFEFPLEIQMYSRITSIWRDMSHIVYESRRTGHKIISRPGEATTRLVSLGHLLHIAECELERLMTELK